MLLFILFLSSFFCFTPFVQHDISRLHSNDNNCYNNNNKTPLEFFLLDDYNCFSKIRPHECRFCFRALLISLRCLRNITTKRKMKRGNENKSNRIHLLINFTFKVQYSWKEKSGFKWIYIMHEYSGYDKPMNNLRFAKK